MAQIETWLRQELTEPVKVNYLDGNVFCADDKGNLVGVEVYKGGSPVTLSGSCTGYCVLATGVSIPVAGTVSGNKAYIVLPDSAYSTPGVINIILKLTENNTVTTLAAVVSTVIGVGGVVVTPNTQTIEEWTAQINAVISSLQNGAVRYDASQSLTTAQKARARTNIAANTSAVNISGDDYKIIFP